MMVKKENLFSSCSVFSEEKTIPKPPKKTLKDSSISPIIPRVETSVKRNKKLKSDSIQVTIKEVSKVFSDIEVAMQWMKKKLSFYQLQPPNKKESEKIIAIIIDDNDNLVGKIESEFCSIDDFVKLFY